MENKIILILLAYSIFTTACLSQDLCFNSATHYINSEQTSFKRLSKDIESLSEEDAINVALLFNKQPETKSSNNVKSVIPIKDSLNSPLLYIVNFDEGYTIVSSTKKYFPVLANTNKGNLQWPTNSGVDIFIQSYLDDISLLLTDNHAPILDKEWKAFEQHEKSLIVKTKVNDDYYDILDEFMDDWYDSGFEFTHLYAPFDDMPDDVYEDFCQIAEDTDYIGYNYMDCALIGRRESSSDHLIPPLISSSWGQFSPYADGNSGALGCTTIAAGQIMRYFQFPAYFAWSGMPDTITSYNSTLGSFLQSLKTAIGVSGGGASIYQVKNALQNYGYSCTIQSHNISSIYYSLQDNKPVYCRGKDVNTNVGHAWICDGCYKYSTQTQYVLFTLSFINGSPDGFEQTESYTNCYYSTPLYHINWGHEGVYDGYYFDSYLHYVNGFGEHRNYSSNDRQELLFHP